MCGINLIIDKHSKLDESFIRKMNTATFHRGPDASSFKVYNKENKTTYLGANRLKIQDTNDAANQPFCSQDGRYALVYNGEIYNHKELKSGLKEFTFTTSSDTETLFYLLIKENDKAAQALNGMFAFAFYDAQEDAMIIARDASGIKPLYYFENEDFFIASSEIKGILSTGLVKKEFNDAQLSHYLNYKYVKKPATIYKNIFELEEGRQLEIKGAKVKHLLAISNDNNGEYISRSPEEIAKDIKQLMFDVVQRHLISDVPAGIFLSGGVDSTLLLAILNEMGIKDFPAFSIVNSEEDSAFGTNDFYYAALAAKKYNAIPYPVEAGPSLLNKFNDFISCIDQPIGDSATLLTWELSKQASSVVKVILSGAGADEYFAGYNRHMAYYKYLKCLKGNNSLIDLLKSVGAFLPEGFAHPLRKEFRLLNKFFAQLDKDPQQTFENFLSLNDMSGLILQGQSKEERLSWKKGEALNYYFDKALEMDKKEYLISDILALTDKMSMQSSVEIRVPYLDKNLLAYVQTISPNQLLEYGRKWPLKKMLDGMDGKVFSNRKKEGFGMPVGQWLKGKEGEQLLEIIADQANPMYEKLSYEKVQKMVFMHMQNKKDSSSELWSLITLAGWMKKEF